MKQGIPGCIRSFRTTGSTLAVCSAVPMPCPRIRQTIGLASCVTDGRTSDMTLIARRRSIV